MQDVADFFQSCQTAVNKPEVRDRNVMAMVLKIDNLKSKCSLDIAKGKVPRRSTSAVVTLDPESADLLTRIRKGKRAFGSLEQCPSHFSDY